MNGEERRRDEKEKEEKEKRKEEKRLVKAGASAESGGSVSLTRIIYLCTYRGLGLDWASRSRQIP
jgi:hypothetical protein